MDRRRFLVLTAASAAVLPARGALAASSTVASVRIVRGSRQLLIGAPGRCAAARRGPFGAIAALVR